MKHIICLVLLVSMCSTGCKEGVSRDATAQPKGTGSEIFRYPNGNIKVEAIFVDGEPKITRWYTPDGELFAETKWEDGKGIGYILRDDGTLAMKGEVVNEVMHGTVWIYDEKGELLQETIYQDGVEVKTQ